MKKISLITLVLICVLISPLCSAQGKVSKETPGKIQKKDVSLQQETAASGEEKTDKKGKIVDLSEEPEEANPDGSEWGSSAGNENLEDKTGWGDPFDDQEDDATQRAAGYDGDGEHD